jgi:hypothetical protein
VGRLGGVPGDGVALGVGVVPSVGAAVELGDGVGGGLAKSFGLMTKLVGTGMVARPAWLDTARSESA